jgi:Extracellular link domain
MSTTPNPIVTITPQDSNIPPLPIINANPTPALQKPPASSASVWFNNIFTQSNILLFIFCFIVYLLVFGLMKLLLGESFSYQTASFVIDCISIVILIIYIVSWYLNISTSVTVYDPLGNLLIWLRNFFDVPSNLLLLSLLMIFLYLMLFVLQVPPGEFKPYTIRVLEIFMWSFFIIDAFAVLFLFLFGFSITDLILNPMINGWYNLVQGNVANPTTLAPIYATAADATNPINVGGSVNFVSPGGVMNDCTPPTPTPPGCTDQTIPIIVRDASGNIVNNMKELRSEICMNVSKQVATPKVTNAPTNLEVFNISNNLYTYDEAQTVCKSYGARLATYDEIEAAYVDGGEWCNYGWSDNQMALFPTQKDTWNRLQLTQNHKHDCGRPGINGGFIDNPDIQFGVNCYGIKPTPGPGIVAQEPGLSFPEEEEDARKLREILDKQLQISNFNRQKWSEYQR